MTECRIVLDSPPVFFHNTALSPCTPTNGNWDDTRRPVHRAPSAWLPLRCLFASAQPHYTKHNRTASDRGVCHRGLRVDRIPSRGVPALLVISKHGDPGLVRFKAIDRLIQGLDKLHPKTSWTRGGWAAATINLAGLSTVRLIQGSGCCQTVTGALPFGALGAIVRI